MVFARYLRLANGELAETVESLGDGVDRGHFTDEQIVPIQRLAKRSSHRREKDGVEPIEPR